MTDFLYFPIQANRNCSVADHTMHQVNVPQCTECILRKGDGVQPTRIGKTCNY
jgi:hypothetical protein